ncbi:MAG: glycosyltransferase family 2 protein [Maioricimonas sp. JB049]
MSELFPLTVVVLTRNEAENIGRCLASVDWCDERVIVDDGSEDATCEIATRYGARVLQRRFDSFAGQRNWALEHGGLRNRWILMLDADEVVTLPLKHEIQRVLPAASEEVAAFRMCRRTVFLGQWLRYSDGFPVWIMRLVDRDRARFVDQGHGEVPVPPVNGRIAILHEPFDHYPFSRGIDDWVERHCRYAEREASLEAGGPMTFRWRDLLFSGAAGRRQALRTLSRGLPARPLVRFLYQYVWKRGFLDGRGGLVFSTLMAFYEALILIKRWERRPSHCAEQAEEAEAPACLVQGHPSGLLDDINAIRECVVSHHDMPSDGLRRGH